MQLYIEHDFNLRSDNGVLKATNGLVTSITGTTAQIIDGTGALQTLNTSIVPELTNLYFTTARAQAAISGSAPISVASGVVSISQANSTTNGYLSSTDWSTFNAKQSALTLGNLTSSDITITGGTGAVVGSGSTLTLATVNSTTGTFGSSTAIPVVTVNGKGLITNISTVAVSIPSGALNFIGDVTGTGTTGSNTTLTLATVNANVYGSNTFLKFAVNGKGLVTSATAVGSADIISALGYTPENVANKSTSTSLGTSNTLYPTQNAVKTYVDSAVAGGIILQGDWNASTNTPDITGTTTTGWAWRVTTAGSTNLGGIIDWQVSDLAVKSATGWIKIDNTDQVLSVFGRYGVITAQSGDYTTTLVTEGTNLYYTQSRFDSAFSAKTTTNLTEGTNLYFTNTRAQNAITLTTTGSSGAATYSGGTLNIPNYGSALSGYVPYTGATGNVNLGSYNLSLNALQFASISAPSYSEGLVWYDSSQKSLAFYNDSSSSIVYIGEDVQMKVINNTGATIPNGSAVYVTGTSSGQSYPNIALAQANSLSTSAVIGLTNGVIANGAIGYVTSHGVITGVNTSMLTVGQVLYLSPYSAGQLMNTVPPTGYAVQVGTVTYSNSSNGSIYVKQTTPLAVSASTITGTVAIANGGTGASTASAALSNLGGIGLTALSASTPLSYNNTTGAFSISQATNATNGYLSSTDWNTFNNKQAALGYTAANDSLVVHLSGTETITGFKTFTSAFSISGSGSSLNTSSSTSVLMYAGAYLAQLGLGNNAFTYYGDNILGMYHTRSSTSTTFNLRTDNPSTTGISYTTSLQFTNNANNVYTLPNATGTLALTSDLSSYVPTSRTLTINGTSYDLSANRSWTIPTNINARTETSFTATAGQTTFTVSYTVGQVDVYYNGSKLAPAEFTATTGTSIVLATAALVNDIIDVVAYTTGGGTGGTGTTNYISKWTASGTIGNSLIYDNGAQVTIGNTNGLRAFNIYSATADNHLAIYGPAPSVSLSDAPTGTYQAKFGLATASGQYAAGAVAGDFVIISQTGSTIWANSGGERMRLNTNGTFSIGNTNSTYNLDVTGTGRFTGAVRINTNTSGLILNRDAVTNYNGISYQTGNVGKWFVGMRENLSSNNYIIYSEVGTDVLTLNQSTGAATFSSSVTAGSFSTPSTGAGGSTTWNLYHDQSVAGDFGIYAGGTNRMYFGPSGNVGIGTTSPSQLLDVAGTLRISGSPSNPNDASAGYFWNQAYVGPTLSGNVIAFNTGGTGSQSERMRITSGGNVLIGTTTDTADGKLIISGGTSNIGITLRNNTTADRYKMFVGGGGAYINDDCYVVANNTDYHIKNTGGGVKLSNGATSWVADSDIRLKDKVSDINNAIGLISQLETMRFNWKRDAELENKPTYFGLVAQNAKEVIPEVVDTGRDEMQTLGIRYTEVIPILVKAIQEQQAQIEAQNQLITNLQERLVTLENK